MWFGRRRRIIIDNFQYRLLTVNLVYFFTILLIFAAALFLPLIVQLHSEALPLIEKHEVASQFLSLHARVWPAIFVVFVLLAIHSVLVSHRIAGPIYRFRTTLKAITQGDLTVRATLRTNDYFQREADIIYDMIASLSTRIKGIEEQSGEVVAGLAELKKAIDSGSVNHIQQNMENIEAHICRLNVYAGQFRTVPEETRADADSAASSLSASPSGDSRLITRS